MKLFSLLTFTLLLGFGAFAQQNVFRLTAQKQILSIHLNEDNSNKILTIDSKGRIANVQRLTIRGLAPEADQDWARTFQIATADNAEAIISFSDEKETGVYNYGLKDLVEKLSPGTYKLYTIAVPKDAAKAAELKPKRILVATLVVV